MSGKYILDGHIPVLVEDVLAWGQWFETSDEQRRVALTYFDQDTPREVQVSTVFLAVDYNFDPNGLPLVFETMVFGGEYDHYTDRYTTWDEAEEGHARIVAAIKAQIHLVLMVAAALIIADLALYGARLREEAVDGAWRETADVDYV